MKQVILDGNYITTRAQLHDALTEQLQLPEWYGRNLDALYDCLGEMRDVEIILRGWPREGYLARAMDLMLDAARENPSLRIYIAA